MRSRRIPMMLLGTADASHDVADHGFGLAVPAVGLGMAAILASCSRESHESAARAPEFAGSVE